VRRRVLAVGVVALFVAGCSQLSLEPSASLRPAATPASAVPSPGGSARPTASTAPSAAPSFLAGRHADPALEALLPTSLGGSALIRESQAGSDLSRESEALNAFLTSLDRTLADFTIASAYDAGGGLEAVVGAWRIRDADSNALLPGFVTAVQASSTTPLTIAEQSLGGRKVTRIGAPGELTQGPIYAYVRGDVILFVQSPHEDLAEAALTQLPAP
jgi:hypothetical protein